MTIKEPITEHLHLSYRSKDTQGTLGTPLNIVALITLYRCSFYCVYPKYS